MFRRHRLRLVLAVGVLAASLAATLPSPAQAPSADALHDLVGLDELPEGLPPLDPALGDVADLVLGVVAQIGELAEAVSINTMRLGGADAVDAAIAFSQATHPDGAQTAILGRDDVFADAFSSGVFQGHHDAPLLLTSPHDLDPRTGAELQRLGMDGITILGGEQALDETVIGKLEIAGLDVQRVAGATRVETALAAASLTHPTASTVVLTRAYPDEGMPDSQAYADLLAAGPYAAENGWPILQTPSDTLHPAVRAALTEGLVGTGPVTEVVVIGGTSAVSLAVEDAIAALGISVRRIAGANRFATAVAIAEARGFASSGDAERVIVVESSGRDDIWAPGFAASGHGDLHDAPVVLTDGSAIPPETLAFVTAGIVDNLTDGGPAVMCATFVSMSACQAVGALMIGNLAGGMSGLPGLLPADLPQLGGIMAGLALRGLLTSDLGVLLTSLAGGIADGFDVLRLLTDLVDSLLRGDAAAVTSALEAVAVAQGFPDLATAVLAGGLVSDAAEGLEVVSGLLATLGELAALPEDVQDTLSPLLDAGASTDDLAEVLGALQTGDDAAIEDIVEALQDELGDSDEPVEDVLDDLLGDDLLDAGASVPALPE